LRADRLSPSAACGFAFSPPARTSPRSRRFRRSLPFGELFAHLPLDLVAPGVNQE
jgi:hypothetical protein